MKLALFLAAALVLGFATVVAAPVAAACDSDNPCDPMPLCTGGAVACAKTLVSCVAYARC